MSLDTLVASLLRNLLTGKVTIRAGKGTVSACQDFQCNLILQQVLKYESIVKTNLNLFCSRNDLPKIKDRAYLINLHQYESYMNRNSSDGFVCTW